MTETKSFESAFSSWKIILAIALGLGIAGFMMYRSLQQTHFVDISDLAGEVGTHSWVDHNGNGQVDIHDATEFREDANGQFRKQKLGDILREISWTSTSLVWLLLAILFMVGRDFGYVWRIKILTKNKLTWGRGTIVIMLWEFASALSPGVIGGTAVAMFIMNKEKIDLGRSTAIVVITAMLDNLFYILMVPFVFLFVAPSLLFPAETGADRGVEFAFWSAYVLFSVLGILLFLSIFKFPRLISSIINFVFRLPILRRWKDKAARTGDEIAITANELKRENWRFWIGSFAATCVSWISRYLVINCILAAFLSIPAGKHLFILAKQLILWLVMRVSPTPGGSGVAEYAFGELMSDFSQSTLLLAGLAIIWRLISYFPYLFIGAFIFPRWIKRK